MACFLKLSNAVRVRGVRNRPPPPQNLPERGSEGTSQTGPVLAVVCAVTVIAFFSENGPRIQGAVLAIVFRQIFSVAFVRVTCGASSGGRGITRFRLSFAATLPENRTGDTNILAEKHWRSVQGLRVAEGQEDELDVVQGTTTYLLLHQCAVAYTHPGERVAACNNFARHEECAMRGTEWQAKCSRGASYPAEGALCTNPSSHKEPPWRQPRGKWMVSLGDSHTKCSKRWHLWEIDCRFALNSTPGW